LSDFLYLCGAKLFKLKTNIKQKNMKRHYEKPAMRVTALQQKLHMLTLSGELSGYSRSKGGFEQAE